MESGAVLGLRENWKQFTLLVIVNAFVGAMVGMERTILPLLAEDEFHLVAKTAMLTFILVFGVTKALSNYFAGRLAQKWGRRKVLLLGWVLAIPVPFMLIWADQWIWVVVANALLGVHQGLSWSSTVVMKMDLVGKKQRGLAMGLNEAAGYMAVGVAAWATGYVASTYGLRPEPFYLGLGFAAMGVSLTFFFVKDTMHHVRAEAADSNENRLAHVFKDTTWRDPWLSSISFSGMINNLNDGLMWGLFPVLLVSMGFDLKGMAWLVGLYPLVWGLGQAFTGPLADKFDKPKIIALGMFIQAVSLAGFALSDDLFRLVTFSVGLGLGTALVYPTFLAAVADRTHPDQRAESVGVYRLWRDLGYAFGALISGVLYDFFGLEVAFLVVSVLCVIAGVNSYYKMKKPWRHPEV